MGSQLRKLRVQAGVTGEAFQRTERLRAQARARAARVTKAAPAACTSCGSAVQDPRKMLCGTCAAALAAASARVVPSWAGDEARKNQERRIRLAHTLGSHELPTELGDRIQAAALAKAHASVGLNSDVVEAVWELALVELRRGVVPAELSALRVEPPRTAPAPVAVDLSDISAAAAIAQAGPAIDIAQPRPPAAGMSLSRRMPMLAQVMVLSMLLADVPPKEGR